MIEIENVKINDIPTLFVHKKQNVRTMPSPAVIILHGITNAKEANLHYAYLLAERGFKVFMPDASHHGDRGEAYSDSDRTYAMGDIIVTSVAELALIKASIVAAYGVNENEIYLGGISMGAITTFAAMTQYGWIKGAFSMMGDPALVEFAKAKVSELDEAVQTQFPIAQIEQSLARFDLSLQPEKLRGRPLFIWHGDADVVVPINSVRAFVDQVKIADPQQPIEMVIEQNRGHKVNRFGYLQLVDWLADLPTWSEQ